MESGMASAFRHTGTVTDFHRERRRSADFSPLTMPDSSPINGHRNGHTGTVLALYGQPGRESADCRRSCGHKLLSDRHLQPPSAAISISRCRPVPVRS